MSQPDGDDLDFGTTLKGFRAGLRLFHGRYELLRMLGRGGMGVVWLARDRELDHAVALKFLPETMIHDEEAIADLKGETRRCMGLTHPHIVRVFDFLRDDEVAAVSMEYVEGRTLQQAKLEQEGRCFEAEAIAPWIGQVCEALAYAHGEGRTVHRDLKPANVMVEAASGRAKLTDFGIAGTLTDSMTRLTRGGASPASGTLPYMSPQQAMGYPPSVADDVYALGATIYELLTGKPPFFRGEILRQIETMEPPSMAERRRELGLETAGAIPAAWEETVAACLAKAPADRPASVAALWERLRATGKPGDTGRRSAPADPDPVRRGGESQPERPAPPPRPEPPGTPGRRAGSGRVGLAAAAIGLLAAGAILVGILRWGDAEPAPSPPAGEAASPPSAGAASGKGGNGSGAMADSAAAVGATAGAVAVRQELETLLADLQAAASEAEARAATAQALAGQLTGIEVEVMGSRENGPVGKDRLDEAARLGALAQAEAAAADQAASRARTAAARAGEIGSGHPDPAIQALARSVAEAAEPIGESAADAATWAAQAAESLRIVRAVAADAAAAAARPMATGPGGATKERPWENSLGMRFVPVPIGNGPSAGRTVLFSIWETRVRDYAAYAAENAGVDMEWKDYEIQGHAQGPDHPVVNVNWEDAQAFCEWLTKTERAAGRIGPGDAYRLPTDVEWSWAVGIGAREDPEATPEEKDGGIEGEYPWGTAWPPPQGAGNYSGRESASSLGKLEEYEDDHAFTAPVGSYPANALGLHDLGGNVWEWCEDGYDSDEDTRVVRGASWLNYTGIFLRSSSRLIDHPTNRLDDGGFRLVVVAGGVGG